MRPSKLLTVALATALLVVFCGAARGASGSGSAGARLKPIGGFDQPVFVTGTRAFPRMLFVVERPGVIRAIRRGKTLERPFLDITSMVESGFQERGLLSVAFPPDYRTSRRFYVYYTNHDGDLCVDEFLRSRNHPARAVRSSRRRVLTVPHPTNANHDGGQLQFHGNDLFVGTGDGGSAGDPPTTPRTPVSCSASCCGSTRAGPRRGAPIGCRAQIPSSAAPGAMRSSASGCEIPTASASRSSRAAPTGW